MKRKSNVSVGEMHQFVKGFQCSMLISSVFMFNYTGVMVFRGPFLHIPVFWCYLLQCTLLSLLQVVMLKEFLTP